MDVVKKNLLSIIFGVIALLAVAALFYPIGGMYTALQAGDTAAPALPSLNGEASKYDETNKLLTTKRLLPIMPALGTGDSTPQYLDVFPNEPVIAAGQKAVDAVHEAVFGGVDASGQKIEGLIAIAEDRNRHEPLVPQVLPDVPGTLAYDFQTAYQEQLKAGGAITTQLQATWPPTDDEIAAAAEALWKKDYEPQIYLVQGQPANKEELKAQCKQACLLLPIQMRDDAARKFKIYMHLPGALEVNPVLLTPETPHADQVWYAQLSLWVEQDVATAIALANKNSTNVSESAVKQLVKLSIPEDYTVYVTAQGKNGQGGGPKPDANAPGGPDFVISPTGRVCNSLYDVVHFTLVLDVDATRLPAVLLDLEQNKLITVMQVDATSVDSAAALDNGFVYGKSPVVEVTLQCESLFLRSWVDKLMPRSVQEEVHGAVSTPGGPGGPGEFRPPHHNND